MYIIYTYKNIYKERKETMYIYMLYCTVFVISQLVNYKFIGK